MCGANWPIGADCIIANLGTVSDGMTWKDAVTFSFSLIGNSNFWEWWLDYGKFPSLVSNKQQTTDPKLFESVQKKVAPIHLSALLQVFKVRRFV